ncbi:MAG: putative ATP-dependent protease [Paracoccaceae bacterium]|jgi:predicted ATP-dependent protease
MTAKKLAADEIGIPAFAPGTRQDGAIFDLSSHTRAREALELALAMPEPGFNVFVLGENQSGRLTSTVEFLKEAVSDSGAPDDWVYLNDFGAPAEPVAVRLPVGEGRKLRDAMQRLTGGLTKALRTAFGGESFQSQMQAEGEAAQTELNTQMQAVQNAATEKGLNILQNQQGPVIVATDEKGEAVPAEQMTDDQRALLAEHGPALAQQILAINRRTAELQAAFQQRGAELSRQVADQTSGPVIDTILADFSEHHGLNKWLIELRNDITENFQAFLPPPEEGARPPELDPARRYAVNLLVDNQRSETLPVIVEANPTYENLFGRIEYRQSARAMETDFTLIKPGAFHRANGGVLVLRADAIASNPSIWPYIKGALRDQEIRIEELYRSSGPTVAGALSPQAVPLDIKVVLIGAPNWYYTFFSTDPEFQSYFRVKADIDPDFEAETGNIETYAGLVRQLADGDVGGDIKYADSAIVRLLGQASRWAADRTKLSSQFERIQDILAEARYVLKEDGGKEISAETVETAIENRRHRNARIEDRIQEGISEKAVLIATSGTAVGQVNALTVRNVGDHTFGTPSRVTASASVGRRGVLNIERDTGLGGPLQQKGALVLQGWLSGTFARAYPLSFNVSITFEQSYGGVDGDSASLAELVAILSDISGVPVRQDLAITGSVNQHGAAQAIGGAHHKIEGFFRSCVEAGTLDGAQGAAIPCANEKNLVLRADVEAAVREGTFSVYSLETIEDAVELFLGMPAGAPDAAGKYPDDTVFGRVSAKLAEYDKVLMDRKGAV